MMPVADGISILPQLRFFAGPDRYLHGTGF